VLFVLGGEWLRAVEEPFAIGSLEIPGIPGMRMVIFSILLIGIMIFARQGIMGREEFSWQGLFDRIARLRVRLGRTFR
jgi:branched-chain amino acid transport system permease protein